MCGLRSILLAGVLWTLVNPAWAGEADVLNVSVKEGHDGRYTFHVTVRHHDTGWDHYADKWEIVATHDGRVLATRILHHPHVSEQPFTRSLSGVTLPASVRTVTIRAHDSLHAYGGRAMSLDLP